MAESDRISRYSLLLAAIRLPSELSAASLYAYTSEVGLNNWRLVLVVVAAFAVASCSQTSVVEVDPTTGKVAPIVAAPGTPDPTADPLPTAPTSAATPASPLSPAPTPQLTPSRGAITTPKATPAPAATATPTPSPTPYPPSRFVLSDFTAEYLSMQPTSVHFVRDFPDGIGPFVERAVLEGRIRYGNDLPDLELLWHLEGKISVEWRFLIVDGQSFLSVGGDDLETPWIRSGPLPSVVDRAMALFPELPVLLSWEFIENGAWEMLDDGVCGGNPCHRFSQTVVDDQVILAVDRESRRPLSISVRTGPADGRYTRSTTEFLSWNEDLIIAPPAESEEVPASRLAYAFFWPLTLLGIESEEAGTLSLSRYLNAFLPPDR